MNKQQVNGQTNGSEAKKNLVGKGGKEVKTSEEYTDSVNDKKKVSLGKTNSKVKFDPKKIA